MIVYRLVDFFLLFVFVILALTPAIARVGHLFGRVAFPFLLSVSCLVCLYAAADNLVVLHQKLHARDVTWLPRNGFGRR